jgi:hypothetical protein
MIPCVFRGRTGSRGLTKAATGLRNPTGVQLRPVCNILTSQPTLITRSRSRSTRGFMEPGSLVLDETATTLTESKAKSSECGLAVVRDIYYLKLLAIEVVCQLVLDTVSERPKDSPLFSQRVEQIQEEMDQLNQCRIFLSQRDALETSPLRTTL